jgi:hypothetical protein
MGDLGRYRAMKIYYFGHKRQLTRKTMVDERSRLACAAFANGGGNLR